MLFRLPAFAITAGLLVSTSAVAAQDIPSDVPVSSLLNSAQTHLRNGETSEALNYYDAAIARDPGNYLTFFKRATTYLSLGRTSHATDDFNKVLELKPNFESAHVQLAKIKAKFADWEASRADYLAAGKDESSPEVAELDEAKGAVALAEDAEKRGDWEQCVDHLGKAIFVASRAPSLRELRSRCRFERGELEEGLSDLQHLLNMRPGDTRPHVVISATSFYAMADLDNGLAQIRKCLHSDPDSKSCKKLHRQQKAVRKALDKVDGQLSRNQPVTAKKTLVGSSDEPGLMQTVREQVDELRQAGSIPASAKSGLYTRIVEMTCQATSDGGSKDAEKYCDEALELDEDSFSGLLHRGKTLLKQEDYEGAIRHLEQAEKARPDKADKVRPIMTEARLELKRSKTKDYYKVLGVARDADERQIKSAYRKASKVHHPDKAAKQGISKEDAEKKMASINEAYEVLSDPELRARFDRGDDPNSQERSNPFEGSPFGGGGGGGQNFFFQQGAGGGGSNFKFKFGSQGGNPFGF